MANHRGILVALALLAGAGCGGDDGVSTAECIERWNGKANGERENVAQGWDDASPDEIRAWIGPSKGDDQLCATLIEIEPGGSGVFAYRESTLEGAGEGQWAITPREWSETEWRGQLEEYNARGARGGSLAPRE